MANFTDTLTTVFQLSGGAQMAREMNQIALAAGDLATGVQAATAGIVSMVAALGPLAIILLAVTAAIDSLKAAFDLVSQSIKTFAEESKQLFQTGVLLKNLGSSLTLPQLRQFADQLSRQTGISRSEIEGGAGGLVSAGLAGGDIEKTLKTIADAARTHGKTFEDMTQIVQNGVVGIDKGLKRMGVTLFDTGSRAANLQLILQQLNLRDQGGAAAFRETLPGSIDAMSAALERFMSALGENFAPAAIRIFNKITDVLDFFTAHAAMVADTIANMFLPILGPMWLHHVQALDAGKDPMAKVGMGGDPATEKTLSQVADNTKIMADSVVQSVLGGQGQIVEQAFGFMTARMAMAI